jgi:ribosome biogenesis GTPase
MTGRILKGVGGFYTVLGADDKEYECRACGRFRNEGETPLPGDDVDFSPQTAYVDKILPRRSELKRPRVANVDMVAIVASADRPKMDSLLCDKLIISARRSGIYPLLVINKCDAASPDDTEKICADYRGAADTLCVSARTGLGLEELKARLSGRCVCFAGQSAVGKSSLLNAMFPGLTLKTDGLSKKTDRGKHTTRHAELLVPEGFFGMVVDTPGFSFFESDEIEPAALWRFMKICVPLGAAADTPRAYTRGSRTAGSRRPCSAAKSVQPGTQGTWKY